MCTLQKDLLNTLKTISIDTFIKFYYDLVLDKTTRRRLTVVMYGKDKETELNVDCNINYEQIAKFKLKEYLCF